jgi:hypothetical protein
VGLLAFAAAGVVQLPAVQQQVLLKALQSLLVWLPVLYGVVALSYAGRYWRGRLLLGRLGIGRTNWPDLMGWFRGFALTATPAKVGELNRVQLLHEQLGYPRLPLVHVFVAERCADVAAVALLLLVLTPAQVLGRLPSVSTSLLLVLVLVALVVALLISRPALRRWLQTRWQHWRHHLPRAGPSPGRRCLPPWSQCWCGPMKLWSPGCWCVCWPRLRAPFRRRWPSICSRARPGWPLRCRAASA